MPSRILSIPFIIAALVMLYLTWEVDASYSVWIIPPALALALIYIFSPQIDWLWRRRRPPELEAPLRRALQDHAFYQQLSPEEKTRFRQRVALYLIAHEFQPQAMENVPEDVKGVVAINAVHLTFGQEDYLLPPFERIVVYPMPFPSPQFPHHFHASEIYEEDGVLLFAAEPLMRSFLQPRQWYNVGLHEFAKALLHQHPEKPWPALGGDIWEKLEQISGFSREAIVRWINLPEAAIAPAPVSIVHFLIFPEKFKEVLPELYGQYAALLYPAGARASGPRT